MIRGRKYNKILSLPIVNKMIGRKKSKSKFYLRTYRRLRKYVPSVEIKKIYLESTHSFIKSFGEEFYKLKSDIKLIHLTRNPLEVAKSLLNRNSIPSPNNIYLLNPDFKKNELKIIHKLSNYQKCLWYWFEIELRHISFINKYEIDNVYDIDMYELNNINEIKKIFSFFNIEYSRLKINVNRNANRVPTEISQQNYSEAKKFLEYLPDYVFDRIQDIYSIKRLENYIESQLE